MSGKKKEDKGLLDGEEFDDDDTFPQHRTSYRDRAHFQSHSLARSTSPAPSLLKSRTSETGSIFREEVWPPPGFDDPIAKQSSQVDLSRIVDDVMGPGSGLAPASSASARGNVGSHERDITDASTASAQSQLSSSTMDSSSPLLASSSRAHPLSAISVYNDPFGPSSQASVYYPTQLPPGAYPPTAPGLGSSLIATSSTMSSSSEFDISTTEASPNFGLDTTEKVETTSSWNAKDKA
ncbi:hypothetical protein BDZ97DRAFT_1924810 [Flammula alnicola]|nr:hypothetical protein BDZ97DRAFT_1924810 [Flammula alnicola]